MSADPPKRHHSPSRSDGDRASIEVDRTVGGATEQRRFDLPKRGGTLTGLPAPAAPGSRPPPAPALPLEYAPTKRPPLPWGKTVRAPSPPPLVAASRRTDPPAAAETTATESAPQAPPDSSLPPPSLSPDAASLEALRRRAESAEARRDELERRERIRAEAASPASWPPRVAPSPVPQPEPVHHEEAPTPHAWRAAIFKFVVGLGALLTAAATILSVRANTAIEPKVETQAVRTGVVETAADTLTSRVSKLEAYARAETKRRQCVEAQLRDALARGTGHVLTTLPSTVTLWSEQNSPKAEPRLFWKTPTWFTTDGCDAAPAPP